MLPMPTFRSHLVTRQPDSKIIRRHALEPASPPPPWRRDTECTYSTDLAYLCGDPSTLTPL